MPKTRFALLWPVRRWMAYAAFLSLCINVLTLATPIYMLQIFDRVLVSRSLHTLGMLTVVTVVLVAAYAVLDTVRARLLLRAGIGLEQDLGPRVLDRLLRFDLPSGQLGGRSELMRDVVTLRNYLSSQHLSSLFDSPWVPVFTLLIFGFSWVLGVITLVGMLILLALAFADEKFTYRHFTEAQTANQTSAQVAHGAIGNAEIVHALGMKDAMVRLWSVASAAAQGALKRATDRGVYVSGTTKAARLFVQITMLGVGVYLVIAENLPPGIMIVSTIIVSRAISPLESAISGWRTFVEVRNAYSRIDALLRYASQESLAPRVTLPVLRGGISLEGVHIALGPRATLLGNVSIRLEPGQTLGLIGPSGAGKSTLARTILGLIRPVQGSVMLDGFDINQYDRTLLGRQLGYLPQNVDLFAGTLAQNICRMQDPREHSEEIIRVGERLHLGPFIASLHQGYDSSISENGFNLSGGQRQLVGLARAFFGAPRIVVLDEPDANLDQQGELQLIRLIDELRESRQSTLIVVSHNPRIIDRMDRLLLLRDGAASPLVRQAQTASVAPHPSMVGGPRKGQTA